MAQEVKDPALPLQQLQSRLWLGFSPWLGNVHTPQAQPEKSNKLKRNSIQSSRCGSVVRNLTSIREDVGSVPGLAQWAKDLALLQAAA